MQQNSPEFEKTLKLLETTTDHFFITGRAGTGKSTLLTNFRDTTSKKIVVLAPTGVAAVNVSGQTIHSFFGFRPDITREKAHVLGSKPKKAKLYQALDAIVIDEISMVRADLMDCIDVFLRRVCKTTRPFGGKQMIMFGDLFQLPPIVTSSEAGIFRALYRSPYFFDSYAMDQIKLKVVELTHVYRQKDPHFIELLNAVRGGQITSGQLEELNVRVDETYEPSYGQFVINLTATNSQSDAHNTFMLARLLGNKVEFVACASGAFSAKSAPAPEALKLRVGAQVMLTNNDKEGRWINGTVGRIVDILEQDGEEIVQVQLENGEEVNVTRHTWEMFNFTYDLDKQSVESEIVGTYTQFPLMLAWSITIHKSQGKTFEKVVIDLGRGAFAHGQTYVALSRCVSLEGIILKKPIYQNSILMDPAITTFFANRAY